MKIATVIIKKNKNGTFTPGLKKGMIYPDYAGQPEFEKLGKAKIEGMKLLERALNTELNSIHLFQAANLIKFMIEEPE